MIICCGNVKGGVGKTTLAVNLTIALAQTRDVLLVDGDDQATALAFTALRTAARGEPGYSAVALQGAALRTQVRRLAPKFDDVVIDVGGREDGSLRAALTVAALLLMPTRPRSFDLWGIEQTAALVREARTLHQLRAVCVLNAADPAGPDNAATASAVRDVAGVELCPVWIGNRKAFPNAAAAGRSVLEAPAIDAKARTELLGLCDWLDISPKAARRIARG